jgi:hypothetical protein
LPAVDIMKAIPITLPSERCGGDGRERALATLESNVFTFVEGFPVS